MTTLWSKVSSVRSKLFSLVTPDKSDTDIFNTDQTTTQHAHAVEVAGRWLFVGEQAE
jgi:hypothetical protein